MQAGPRARMFRRRSTSGGAIGTRRGGWWRRVAARAFTIVDGVALGEFVRKVQEEFFPALLPGAAILLLSVPNATGPHPMEVKVRLGAAAPPGLTLHALAVRAFDPAHGGRWNAGSNRRSGGTAMSPSVYAAHVRERLRLLRAFRGAEGASAGTAST